MILGIDPSLTGTGWCVMQKESGVWKVVDKRILKTSPATKKKRIYKADDDARRIRYIFEGLTDVVQKYSIPLVVTEAPSGGGKSASAVKGMAFATAIVACLAEAHDLALVTVTAQASKKHNCGRATASKEEMQKAVAQRYPALGVEFASGKSKSGYTGDFEDIADSICAVHTAEKDPAVVMAGMASSPVKKKFPVTNDN
jgi:Holliday junction resolvasome RuvABC endonuclease subunit